MHEGDPPELFQPGIPVVLEGRWSGDHFASDRIMVKHSEQYKAGNPDRVKDYTQAVNAVVGQSAVLLGFLAAVFGVVTLASGLRRGRPNMLRAGRSYVWLVSSAPSWRAWRWSGRSSPTTSRWSTWPRTAADRRRCCTRSRRCGARSRARSCCGRWCSPGYITAVAIRFRDRGDDAVVAWALLVGLVVAAFFFGLMLGPANPFRTIEGAWSPTAPDPTRCCRTTRSWRTTRRCCTSATSA